MKLYGPDGAEIVNVTTLDKKGPNLLVRGHVFGAMPIAAELRPEEARKIFQLLTPRVVLCILMLMFWKSSKPKDKRMRVGI